MADLTKEFMTAAALFQGYYFNAHYMPTDPCGKDPDSSDFSLTSPWCMERGLGQNRRFDCVGLSIAAICRVVGIDPQQGWPIEFRHMEQLQLLAEHRQGYPGDTVVIYESRSFDKPGHMGILWNEGYLLHSTFGNRSGLGTVGVTLSTVRDWNKISKKFISPEKLMSVLDT